MSISKRSVLACLTREQLLEFAQGYRVPGLIGKTKDVILDTLAVHKGLTLEKILRDLKRAELKDVCAAHGLDDSGREIELIVQRILAAPTTPASKPVDKGTTKAAGTASPDALSQRRLWKPWASQLGKPLRVNSRRRRSIPHHENPAPET